MKYYVGQRTCISKKITENDVYIFAGLTGDFNPIHLNADIAAESIFGQRIIHGMLVASLISNVLGTQLPGIGSIYLEQNLKFVKPVYFEDTVSIDVEVSEILNEQKGIIKLSTSVRNQRQETVIEGYAIMKVDGNN